jgi:hypothetical protein
MLVFVFPALLRASIADLGAQAANFHCHGRAARHEAHGKVADLRAVDVGGDAVRHHSDVLLLEAGRCAVITGNGTGLACFNTGLVGLVAHGFVGELFIIVLAPGMASGRTSFYYMRRGRANHLELHLNERGTAVAGPAES